MMDSKPKPLDEATKSTADDEAGSLPTFTPTLNESRLSVLPIAASTPPILPIKAASTPPTLPQKAASTPPIPPQKAASTPPIPPRKAACTPPILPRKAASTPPIPPRKAVSTPPVPPRKAASPPPLPPRQIRPALSIPPRQTIFIPLPSLETASSSPTSPRVEFCPPLPPPRPEPRKANDVGLTSSHKSNCSKRECKVWYRHSGQTEAVDDYDYISDNELKAVGSFDDIAKDIGSNHITHFYIQLGDEMPPLDDISPHITHLRLKNFKRSHSLGCMKSLRQLQVLRLKYNDFSWGLPDVFSNLTSLTELDLMECQLTHLSQSMESLQQLKILDLRKNKFAKGLPTVVSKLQSLTQLYLSECQLNDFPQGMESLVRLQVLNVSENKFFRGVPDVVGQLASLTKLDLSYCQLVDLPQSMECLQRLKDLDMTGNNFSKGLPEVVGRLTSLTKLILSNCQLSDLPQSLCQLTNLQVLSIGNPSYTRLTYDDYPNTNLHSQNVFTELPSVIYQLSNIQVLSFHDNNSLKSIHSDILELTKLKMIACDQCKNLVSPPYRVCMQGISAIKTYFKDLLSQAGTQVTAATVAVVGRLNAGKTSLIQSLKYGKRHLTFRENHSPKDEATQVFKTERLELSNSVANLVDFGGHEVYHITYQLATKDHCIPVIVVNFAEYADLSDSRGSKEATRYLCFNWMSHFYLAFPHLGAPILILTHRDMLGDEKFEECLENILKFCELIRTELLEEEKMLPERYGRLSCVQHLSDIRTPVIHREDIFVFDDKDNNVSIGRLKRCLESRSIAFTITLPRNWQQISTYIEEQRSKPYLLVSDVKKIFPSDDCEVILKYLHNSGIVLWFTNKPALKNYIFHQIPKITDMIAILFHHSADIKWKERIKSVTAFTHKDKVIEKQLFVKLVQDFNLNGILDEAVLFHLLETESEFSVDVAIELLLSFHIIHGPLKQHGVGYIIPYFCTKYIERAWLSDGYLKLRLDIVFNGLAIPQYVYQLMTVVALNFLSDETNTLKVASNGATILHGSTSTYLVHDYNNRKVTLQVSTDVELLDESWKRLLELAQRIETSTTSVWKAARPVFSFYCSHCLFLNLDNPDTIINPSWFNCLNKHLFNDALPSVTTFTGVEPVLCDNDESEEKRKLSVLKPLRYPCYKLTKREKAKLKKYLKNLEQERQPPSAAEEINATLGEASTAPVDPRLIQTEVESDLSDVEEEGYANLERKDNVYITLDLKPCTKQSIRNLYLNTTKVYPMRDGVRGRFLMINNQLFANKPQHRRPGASVDFANLKGLFEKMNFVMVGEEVDVTDLTSQEMLDLIKEETTLPAHHQYSMFLLVLMSHGASNDQILCSDNVYLPLSTIQDLLTASKFPAMKGKPKLIIVQACAGNQPDRGVACGERNSPSQPTPSTQTDDVTSPSTQTDDATSPSAQTDDVTSPSVQTDDVTPPSSPTNNGTQSTLLAGNFTAEEEIIFNADDFIIIKSSSESYSSLRYTTHGSPFIRILVATFYRHSCHRDVESLFKIIQERVRKTCKARRRQVGDRRWAGGAIPECRCTFTNFRKLYFFPLFDTSALKSIQS